MHSGHAENGARAKRLKEGAGGGERRGESNSGHATFLLSPHFPSVFRMQKTPSGGSLFRLAHMETLATQATYRMVWTIFELKQKLKLIIFHNKVDFLV